MGIGVDGFKGGIPIVRVLDNVILESVVCKSNLLVVIRVDKNKRQRFRFARARDILQVEFIDKERYFWCIR